MLAWQYLTCSQTALITFTGKRCFFLRIWLACPVRSTHNELHLHLRPHILRTSLMSAGITSDLAPRRYRTTLIISASSHSCWSADIVMSKLLTRMPAWSWAPAAWAMEGRELHMYRSAAWQDIDIYEQKPLYMHTATTMCWVYNLRTTTSYNFNIWHCICWHIWYHLKCYTYMYMSVYIYSHMPTELWLLYGTERILWYTTIQVRHICHTKATNAFMHVWQHLSQGIAKILRVCPEQMSSIATSTNPILKLSLRLHELRPALALSKLLHFTSRPADSFGVNIVLRNRNEGSSLSLSTTRKHSWNTSTCRSLLYMARHIHVTIRPETFEGLPRSSKPMCDELDHKHVLFRLAPPNIAM